MNLFNFVCVLYIVRAANDTLPAPESHLQRLSSMAKNAYLDAVSCGKNCLCMLNEKYHKAKTYFLGKVKNIAKRGEPVYVGEDGDEKMPEMTDEELKELFEKLFKDLNLEKGEGEKDAADNENAKEGNSETANEGNKGGEEKPL